MRKKINTLLFLFTFLVNSFLIAQHDHLEPLRSHIDDYDFSIEYDKWIKKILFKQLKDLEIRYLVTPSFSPEYVLQIQHNEYSDSYSIINHKALKSIWYSKNKSEVKIQRTVNHISKKDVNLIKKLFNLAIYETRYSKSDLLGFDGTTYTFSVSTQGIKSGETWSPKEATKMFKLKEIAEKLIVESSADDFLKISNELKIEIKFLIDKFILIDESSQLSLKNKVKQTIVNHLNKNMVIDSSNQKAIRRNYDFEYYFDKSGMIKKIKNQKHPSFSRSENNFYSRRDKKLREKFKKTLLTLNLSNLNLENDLFLKIDLKYNKEKKKLVVH